MFQQILFTVLSALLMSPSLSAAKSLSESEPAGGTTDHELKLQIISATLERLEANFFSPTTGIHILSQVHSDGELVQVSITSMDGETIFAVDRPVDSSKSLLTLAGSEFLMINETLDDGETRVTEYAIPEAYSLQVKNAMNRDMLSKSLLRHLDRENVNSSARNAIDNLFMRPEIQLIASAAVALGNTGLHGKENPAAMAFYATALRFSTVLGGHDHHDVDTSTTNGAVLNQRNKRGWNDYWYGSYCSASDSYCYPASYCPQAPNCSGMCGPGCTCWWFVCFDCCWNAGCYYHDVYSCADGIWTLQCWLEAPVALICSAT
jgi:hypothetical protein